MFTRPFTQAEINILKAYYGGTTDSDWNTYVLSPDGITVPTQNTVITNPFGVITFANTNFALNEPLYSVDFSQLTFSSPWAAAQIHTFIHEAWHLNELRVLTPLGYTPEAIHDTNDISPEHGNYNYEPAFSQDAGGHLTTNFDTLTFEQQAEFMADRYLFDNGGAAYLELNKGAGYGGTVVLPPGADYDKVYDAAMAGGITALIQDTTKLFVHNANLRNTAHLNLDGAHALVRPTPQSTIQSMIQSFINALHKIISPHYEPLVFDLGSGIQTKALEQGAFFDNANNSFKEMTGWVGSNTGILVNDPTGGAITNGSQMFGTSTSLSGGGYAVDGFSALADLDSNHDGVINSSDTAWSNLRIWVDSNGNGITDSGEIETMSAAGVASINLTTTNTNTMDANGNYIGKTSTYSLTGGGTHEVADVSFVIDPAATILDSYVTISSTIQALPDISGSGTVADLSQAMQIQANASNTTLEGYLTSFVAATDDATRNILVDEIIYQWTGVQSVSPTARGSYFDARQLEALEQFSGQSFVDPYNSTANPGQQSVAVLTAAYQQLHDLVLGSLESQTNLSGLFNGLQPNTDSTGNPDWNFSAAETQILSDLSANRANGLTELTDFNQAAHILGYDTGAGYATFRTDLVAQGADVTATFLDGAPVVNGTAGNDVITAWAGNQTVIASQGGNDTLIGGGANETFYGSAAGDLFIGGTGDNEVFYGGNNNRAPAWGSGTPGTSDTFIAGQGTETFRENAYGSVTVYYAAGDGNLTLSPYGTSVNTLILDSSITEAAVTLTSPVVTKTLTDGVSSDTVTLKSNYGILQFSDGISINLQGIGSIQHGVAGTTLSGDNRKDFYIYSSGDGHVTLNDVGGANTLFIDSSITDSSLSYSNSGNDLLITDGVGGDQITVKNHLVQTIEFSDGTTSSIAAVGSSYTLTGGGTSNGAALADTYSYASGTGNSTISDTGGGNTLALGAGISLGSLTFTGSTNDLLITDGVSGDQIDILGQEGINSIIQTVTFSGGGSLNLAGIALHEASGLSLLNGTTGNDTLIGNSGTQVLTGNGGNDIFIPGVGNTTAIGGLGNDTYSFASGTGHLTISDTGGSNTIVLGSGISVGNVSWTGTGNDLLITDGVSGDQIYIEGQLDAAFPVSSIVFSGGTTESLVGIALTATSGQTVLNGTLGDDTLTASSGTETLQGNGGNDTYIGSSGTETLNVGVYGGNNTFIIGTGTTTADGGTGDDTYSYASGDGHLTVSDSGGQNTLALGSGLSLGSLGFSSSGNNLLITDGVSGDQITLVDQLTSNVQVQTLEFSDSSTISLEGLTLTEGSGASALKGTAGSDTLIAYSGTQVLTGNGGNDTFVIGTGPTTAIGGLGNDTYSYASGDGHLTITDSAGTNTIVLGSGITTGAVSLTQSGHDLLITDSVTGDQIDVSGQFSSTLGVTSLVFAGGTTETLEGMALTTPSGASILYGTAGSDTLTATSGTQTLIGNGGNDIFVGSSGTETMNGAAGNNTFIAGTGTETMNGNTGNDTYSYNSGDGLVSIIESGGTDTLKLGTGLTASNISFSESSNGNNLLIADGVSGDQITLVNETYSYAPYKVENLVYGDGSTLSLLTGGMAITAASGTSTLDGTAGSDTLTATSGTQKLFGLGGNDIFIGSSGTETMTGSTGNDTFFGGTSTETMSGSGGADVFIAGTSTTALISATGGTGNDIYSFSSGDGHMVITEAGGTDTLKLGTGLTASNVSLSESSNGYNMLLTDGVSGDQITLVNETYGYAPYQVETLVYGDGTTTSLTSGLSLYAPAGNSTLNGTSGNDTLIAVTSSSGTESLLGITGNDVYSYGVGDGSVFIYDTGGSDTLKLGSGITSSNITFGENAGGTDLLIMDGTAGDVVDNYDYITNTSDRLDIVQFSDGSTMNISNAVLMATPGHSTLNGTSGNDVLIGTAGTQVLNGNGGSDTFIAGTGTETMTGNTGNDTYSYNSGDGLVSIIESNGTDTLKLGSGLTASNVSFIESSNGFNLLIADGVSGDQITVVNETYSYAPYKVENLVYGDGSTLNLLTGGMAITAASGTAVLDGTAGNDTLYAGTGTDNLYGNGGNDTYIGSSGNAFMSASTGTGNDTFFGGTGTQTMTGDNGACLFVAGTSSSATISANGGTGNDTYSFSSGDGHMRITETGGTDTLKLGTGLTASNVSFSEASNGFDLLIADGVSGDQITIVNETYTYAPYKVENLIYGDGSTLNLLTGGMAITAASGTSTLDGTAGNDTLTGTSGTQILFGQGGNDTFIGGTGTETMNGNNGSEVYIAAVGTTSVVGGTGNDNYSFASGDGHMTITESGGTDTLRLGTGLTSSNIWIGESSNGYNLLFTDTTSGDQVAIVNQMYIAGDAVEKLVYGDGSTLSLSSVMAASSSATTLNGTTGADIMIENTGNLTLAGKGGSDTYDFGTGMGKDYINNGVSTTNSAAGELYFSQGIADNQLWFDRVDGSGTISSSGNNLRITVMGSSTQMTVNNEFNSGTAYAQLSEFQLSSSALKLDSQLSNLVSAMATFETNYFTAHGVNFDPTNSGNSTITDTTVLSAVSSDWHS